MTSYLERILSQLTAEHFRGSLFCERQFSYDPIRLLHWKFYLTWENSKLSAFPLPVYSCQPWNFSGVCSVKRKEDYIFLEDSFPLRQACFCLLCQAGKRTLDWNPWALFPLHPPQGPPSKRTLHPPRGPQSEGKKCTGDLQQLWRLLHRWCNMMPMMQWELPSSRDFIHRPTWHVLNHRWTSNYWLLLQFIIALISHCIG